MKNISLSCPHCLSRARAYKSRLLSVLFKEISYACTDPDCGYSFVANLEIARTLSLPSVANPDINIPLSQRLYGPRKYRSYTSLAPP